MSTFTEQETDQIRRAFFGAMALVSSADPGFFDTFKESMAGARSLADAPPEIRDALKGGLMAPPTARTKEEIEDKIYAQIEDAMAVLDRDPSAKAAFSDVLLTACTRVAEAAKGVAPAEQQAIEEIRRIVEGAGGVESGDAWPNAPQA